RSLVSYKCCAMRISPCRSPPSAHHSAAPSPTAQSLHIKLHASVLQNPHFCAVPDKSRSKSAPPPAPMLSHCWFLPDNPKNHPTAFSQAWHQPPAPSAPPR